MPAQAPKKVRDMLANAARKQDDPDELGKISKMICVPRSARQFLEIEIQEGRKAINARPFGPDFGKEGCKYVTATRSLLTPDYWCVPYDASHLLRIDLVNETREIVGDFPASSATLEKIGDPIREDDSQKYTAAAASLNFQGNLFAAPCRADRVLEIDPHLKVVREVGARIGRQGAAKYWAIAAHPVTLKIYAIPYDARYVLQIDPVRNGEAKEIGPDLGKVEGKYCSVKLAPNGNLYAPPYNAEQVLQIDAAGGVSLVGPNFGGIETAPRKYVTICEGKNRLLYCPPFYAERVLEINCAKGESRLIGTKLGSGEGKYAAACLGPDGMIYCPPLEARRVLQIHPEFHEAEEIGVDLGNCPEKYSCIACAPSGPMMYAAPRHARQILQIDTKRLYVKEVGPDLGGDKRKYTWILTGGEREPEPPEPLIASQDDDDLFGDSEPQAKAADAPAAAGEAAVKSPAGQVQRQAGGATQAGSRPAASGAASQASVAKAASAAPAAKSVAASPKPAPLAPKAAGKEAAKKRFSLAPKK
eukprot:TRINITY_DN29388_c0_g1_i1.p1 TRINITY_DN29388_c0_g1~~TRINITY_DN29388_c0_g1_i1.p1  ORF type:complete len:531 (+),score=86.01 TRINITY_DN29388_c0_g1_i1:178-1770(+)